MIYPEGSDIIQMGYYFGKDEEIILRRDNMVILDVHLDNIYAFKKFHMNLTYPKKIVGSPIEEEHLTERPNFRYKKVNILMGMNASGKTTFGRALMSIFNFINKKNYNFITDIVADQSQEASFVLDMASAQNVFYRVFCKISPCEGEKYSAENISVEIRQEKILVKDSYESCVKRIESMDYVSMENYMEELEKVDALDWMFMYPNQPTGLSFHKDESQFVQILEHILKALDPSICEVRKSADVEDAYVIRLENRSIVLQDGVKFEPNFLSSGTIAGIEIAKMVSSMKHAKCSFYYCDEKFSFIHSDLEKAILSLMIDSLQPNDQLFFTTHNTDILNMNLPKHSFTFLCKDIAHTESPVSCISASAILKRYTDSLKNAVDNDLFACAPAVDLIYEIGSL